jgi:hypothetical protein
MLTGQQSKCQPMRDEQTLKRERQRVFCPSVASVNKPAASQSKSSRTIKPTVKINRVKMQ